MLFMVGFFYAVVAGLVAMFGLCGAFDDVPVWENSRVLAVLCWPLWLWVWWSHGPFLPPATEPSATRIAAWRSEARIARQTAAWARAEGMPCSAALHDAFAEVFESWAGPVPPVRTTPGGFKVSGCFTEGEIVVSRERAQRVLPPDNLETTPNVR